MIEDFVKPGKVLFEYRDYAFLGEESKTAAKAGYCAAEQDKFWNFHNTVFENQGKAHDSGAFSDVQLRSMAEATALDMNAYDTCIASDVPATGVDDMLAEALAAGVTSTPSIFVDGVQIDWQGYDTLKPAIEEALKKKGA